jgi:hypothetical protein
LIDNLSHKTLETSHDGRRATDTGYAMVGTNADAVLEGH